MSSTLASIHGDTDSGTIPSAGTPGSTPTVVPAGETAVPVPSANPGPATNAAPQTTRVGR